MSRTREARAGTQKAATNREEWAPALQRTAEGALRCVRGARLPYSSGNPSISRMFCTAAPEAPLPRLSSRATSTAW